MANYKAGSLGVELLGISSKATTSIDKVISKLNNLNTAINAIDVSKFATLSSSITAMGTAFDSFNSKNLSSLGTRLNNFSKKMSSMDFETIQKGFQNLTNSVTPFIDKISTAENSLKLLNETLTKVSGRKLKGLSNFTIDGRTPKGKSGGAFSFLNAVRWTTILYIGRRIGRVVGEIAQAGADYTETLNLWETAMGSNLNMATEFVDRMNEAYGISEKTLMNAQAIFKNMLGSLGQISDTMAYQLSEGITQMALDYASLYNVTFEQAFTKFQAALAGQVRPIRSVAGYDITENTLFQLYQSLGGTKTMRQLTRTEKQLLAILAIFRQMNASGAVGDLDKTMESFANQSRVMAEAWQQVLSYSGILLTHLIQQSGLLTYVNAILIFIGDTLKAVAESTGAIQHFGGDIFESITESALEASEATDKLNGKLLDFDKFRAMSGGGENALGLDKKLLEALSSYSSILEKADMDATGLATTLGIMSGLFDEDGVFNPERWNEILNYIKAVGIALGSLFGAWLLTSIIKFFVSPIGLATLAISALLWGIVSFINAWKDMDSLTRAIGIIVALTAALAGLLLGIFAFQSVPLALALAATLGGAILGIYSMLQPDFYANGGMPDKGTLFIAGEAGAEMVYNTPSGQSGVANVQQIEQAMFGALVRYGRTQSANGQPIIIQLDGEKVYQNTTAHAKKHGQVWGNA